MREVKEKEILRNLQSLSIKENKNSENYKGEDEMTNGSLTLTQKYKNIW